MFLHPSCSSVPFATGAAVHDVPAILAEAKDSILTTGKYLNAIRECGREVQRPLPPDVHIGIALVFIMLQLVSILKQYITRHSQGPANTLKYVIDEVHQALQGLPCWHGSTVERDQRNVVP